MPGGKMGGDAQCLTSKCGTDQSKIKTGPGSM